MEMISGPLQQPAMDECCLMRAVVVQDEVNIKIFRDIPVDFIEETTELYGAMPTIAFAEHFACGEVQSGE
jgi:hypothetical protein